MTKLTSKLTAAALLALAAVSAIPALAQFGPGPGGRAPYGSQPPPRNEAGRFDYYSMVLSWSPTFCATQAGPSDPQCAPRRDGRRYAFVLHGLWPQHERGWPESCPTRERPFVEEPLVRSMLDIMPSRNLVIHEYKKHGTCSGLTPEAYFDLSRKLFAKIKVPPRYEGANQAFSLPPDEIVADFVSVNPGLKPDMLAVTCNGPGNRLREIRVCFSREGELKPCGRNEDARRLCGAPRVTVPPVRTSGPASGPQDTAPRRSGPPGGGLQQGPLPGPLDSGPGNPRGERRI